MLRCVLLFERRIQLPIKILNKAIKEYKDRGSFPNINFHVHEGHGACICGENCIVGSLEEEEVCHD